MISLMPPSLFAAATAEPPAGSQVRLGYLPSLCSMVHTPQLCRGGGEGGDVGDAAVEVSWDAEPSLTTNFSFSVAAFAINSSLSLELYVVSVFALLIAPDDFLS